MLFVSNEQVHMCCLLLCGLATLPARGARRRGQKRVGQLRERQVGLAYQFNVLIAIGKHIPLNTDYMVSVLEVC